MNDCQMSVEYNASALDQALAQSIEVRFMDKESEPKDYEQVMKATYHIVKSMTVQLQEFTKEGRFLALMAKELGFDKYLDEEKELEELFEKNEAEEDLKDLLKMFLSALKKRKENVAEKH